MHLEARLASVSESVLPVAERRKARIEAYSVTAASATPAPISKGVGLKCFISYNAIDTDMIVGKLGVARRLASRYTVTCMMRARQKGGLRARQKGRRSVLKRASFGLPRGW